MSRHADLPSRRRGSLVAAAALALSLAGAGALLPAMAASAHDALISSDPAAGATVDSLPHEITLRYSGDLIPDTGATAVDVTDAAGNVLSTGAPQVSGATVRQPLAGSATGTITVTWKVVSGDGHPVSDRFVFGVGAAPKTPAPDSGTGSTSSAGGSGGVVMSVVGVIAAVIVVVVAFAVYRSRRPVPDDGDDTRSERPSDD